MSTQEPNPPANPYESMSEESFMTHVKHLASVIKQKKEDKKIDVDLYDVFGLDKAVPQEISADLKKKLESNEKFLAVAKQILEETEGKSTTVETNTAIDPYVERVAMRTVNDVAGQIKGIDENIPIDEIVNGDRPVFEKLDTLEHIKKVADHFGKKISGLKDTIDKTSGQNEKFTVNGGTVDDWTKESDDYQKMANKAMGIEEGK